jgi:hypothetical protein
MNDAIKDEMTPRERMDAFGRGDPMYRHSSDLMVRSARLAERAIGSHEETDVLRELQESPQGGRPWMEGYR